MCCEYGESGKGATQKYINGTTYHRFIIRIYL